MIGEAIAAACSDPDVLARLGGPLGEAARTAAAALTTLAPDARKATRARWAATVRTPVPPGLRGVHGSWIEAQLAPLPRRARTDLAAGGGDRVGVWLVRWACADVPALPPLPLGARAPVDVATAIARPAPVLEHWLERVGADQVVMLAIASRTTELVQRMPGAIGGLLRASLARVWPFFRKDLMGSLREMTRRCADTPLEQRGLIRIGARTIAPYLAAELGAGEQLVHRLPRELGLVLRGELRAFAATPLAASPTWRAIAASDVLP